MSFELIYINSENAAQFTEEVLGWLRLEYYEKLSEEDREQAKFIEELEKVASKGEEADVDKALFGVIRRFHQEHIEGEKEVEEYLGIAYSASVMIGFLQPNFTNIGSFWHNRESIKESFKACKAMVVVNDQRKVIGFMTWYTHNHVAEIPMVQIKEEYRKQGIFKKMLSDFSNQFPELCALTVDALPKAKPVFEGMGWQKGRNHRFSSRYYKILKTSLEPLNILPEGCAIGIFSIEDMPNLDKYVDFCQVRDNPTQFSRKYFQIDLNHNGKLRTPIIVPFHFEGYMGIYFNGEVIVEGRPKHLFKRENDPSHSNVNLLVLTSLKPEHFKTSVAEKLQEVGFFKKAISRRRTHAPDEETPIKTLRLN